MDRRLGSATPRDPTTRRLLWHVPAFLVHAAAAATIGALLLAAAQPVMTDDVWWHLAMGEYHAHEGPWLDSDPLLHTAVEPAAPAAWLADVALYEASRIAGIEGLRAAHAAVAAAILALAWWLLLRVSRSPTFASIGIVAFANLSAYRIVQLRPHLLSILAVLVLLHLVAVGRRPLSWWRCALVVVAFATWANVHAAFVLGPALLASAAAGELVASRLERGAPDAARQRALRTTVLLALATAATLLNPLGYDQLLHYFAAGQTSPSLELVRDEWAPLQLFAWPAANLPPSLLAWGIAWAIVCSTALVLVTDLRRRLARATEETDETETEETDETDEPPSSTSANDLDPALAAMALTSTIAMVSAVRFLWLGIVPLAALGQWLALRRRTRHGSRLRTRWATAAGVLLFVTASFRFGDWPMISQGVQPGLYARAYPAIKYHAHSVWLLSDAGLEGNLFNSYFMGNFLGYWLAPGMRAFVNGSLNVPPEVMTAHHALMARRGLAPDAAFTDLLDRHRVDVFLGEGLPMQGRRNRPSEYTTSHLEETPGWVPIFRNVHGSLHLRIDERNRGNLQRVIDYYDREGVPFDPSRGFVVSEVVRHAPGWAEDHAIVPSRFQSLQRAVRNPDPAVRRAAQDALASILLLVGEYDRAATLLQQVVTSAPGEVEPRRRLVWALLHAGRLEEGRETARTLLEIAPPDDAFSMRVAETALQADSTSKDELRARIAALPAFTRAEMRTVFYGFTEPGPRPIRHDRFASEDEPTYPSTPLTPPTTASTSETASGESSGTSVSSDGGGSFSK